LSSRELAAALAKDGQTLLPLVDLITHGRAVVDEAIDVMGRATIEAVLNLSAAQVAGAPHRGKRATPTRITRHGRQRGAVPLSDRTLRVDRWRDGSMALRWAAASFVEAEKSMRRIGGHAQLWMLDAALDRQEGVAAARKAG